MNRIMNSTMRRITVRGLFMVFCIISLAMQPFTASPAVAATTLPELWSAGGHSAGADSAGQSARMAVDASGNVAVVSGPALARSLAVTSYTASGSFRWRGVVSPASGTFRGDWVVAAPTGDFVAVGTNVDSHGMPYGVTMVRFASSDGRLLWRVDLARWRPWVARLIADTQGGIYLAFSSIGDGQDIQVHKYDASGILIWSQVISTGFFANDIATSLALSPDETDVVVTGDISGGAAWITAAYNATTGVRKWLVNAPEGLAALDVVVDDERVYVTGQGSAGSFGTYSALTVIAYDRATGARLWRTDSTPETPAGGFPANAYGQRIALAPDGSLVAVGFLSSNWCTEWWIVALETTGAVRWQASRYRPATCLDENPAAVFVLPDGTTVVSGTGGPPVRDILGNSYKQGVTTGYSSNGTLLWEGFSKLPTVWATALPSGDVCATGGYDALITCFDVAVTASPPAAPSGLTARLATGSIVLTWQDNATDETAFSVERSEFSGTAWTNFVALATLPANATSYSDNSFTLRSYNYRVRASNAAGYSAYSNTANITIIGDNPPPTAIMSATPSSGTAPLTVTFDGSQSTDSFGGTVTSWAWVFGDGTVGVGVITTHVYSTPGTYTTTLTVTDNGNASNITTATIVVGAPALPSAPAGLTATALSRSSIRLQWTNTTTNHTEVRIERCRGSSCTNFAQVAVVAGTATAFTDNGLKARTTYRYRVRAHNAAGDSAYSKTAIQPRIIKGT